MPLLRVLHAAADEIEAAAAFYESERPGLGQQFQQAIQDSFIVLSEDIIALSPISPTLTSRGVNRLLMRRFPYSIIIRRVDDNLIEVVAIAHHSRRPGYWRDRLST